MNTRSAENRRLLLLKKLASSQNPMGMNDMWPMVSPETVRAMQARGMIRVEITITPRGLGYLTDAMERQERIATRKALTRHRAKAKAPQEAPVATTPIFVPASSLKKVG